MADEDLKPSSPDGGGADPKDRAAGWSDVLDDVALDGKPGDLMEIVHKNAASHEVASTYMDISPADVGRKQDHRAAAPVGSAASGGALKLPSPAQGRLLGSADTSGAPLNDTFKPEMFNQLAASATTPPRGIPLFPLLGGILVLAALGGGAAMYLLREPGAPPPPPLGAITVTSEPPGATIFVDGKRTSLKTPAEVPGLVVSDPHRVSVELTGHRPFPAESELRIPEASRVASVSFTLKKTLTFEIDSEPPGADLFLNGKSLGLTPRQLPAMIVGESADIALELSGHLKLSEKIVAEEGADLRRVFKLAKAKTIDVVSEPAGADVLLDGASVGKTPVYELTVPLTGRIALEIQKPGYRTHKLAVKARDLKSKISVNLKQLPVTAMPLTPEEKREAKRLDQDLERAKSALARARKNLVSVERTLKTVTSDPKYMFGDRARAEKAFDEATALVEEREQAVVDAQSALEQFRAEVSARFAQ
ncbi:MAG: PEGA domain-containing protein [Deltaproteobacteria bacterium]|nr:PEGA domain-containing protein [Deltaproteobacteria bacterium]